MATNYLVNNNGTSTDLINIFAPLNLVTPIDFSTNYIVNNGNYPPNTDLKDIFAPLNGGTPIDFSTNYIVRSPVWKESTTISDFFQIASDSSGNILSTVSQDG